MPKDLTNQLIVERYKFIQDKIKFLDNVLHVNISLIIKILIAIFTLILSAFLIHLKQPELISIQGLITSLKISAILIFLNACIFLLMSIANIFAWFDYRLDETELLKKFGGEFQRKKPSITKIFTWQETWFAIALICIITLSITVFMYSSDITLSIVN